MNQKTMVITAIVVLAALFAGGAFYYNSRQADQAAQRTSQNREALVRFHSPSLGRADAPVHIVEFLDPACETCRAFYPHVKSLMAENPDKIRLTVRYAPFHPGADDVVKVLEATRKQGKYWQSLEALLASQAGWTEHHNARVDMVWRHLDNLGLDLQRVRADMQSPEILRLLQQDLADAKTLNVTKTPEFFVNGRPLPSFGYDQLKALVLEELVKAGAGR
jgi:protein-disulfide isomerase